MNYIHHIKQYIVLSSIIFCMLFIGISQSLHAFAVTKRSATSQQENDDTSSVQLYRKSVSKKRGSKKIKQATKRKKLAPTRKKKSIASRKKQVKNNKKISRKRAQRKRVYSLQQSTDIPPIDTHHMDAQFKTLYQASQQFEQQMGPFPIQTNTIATIAGNDIDIQKQIVKHRYNSYMICQDNVETLINEFLAYKRARGTEIERMVYDPHSMRSYHMFIDRLITKRPLTFYLSSDEYRLRKKSSDSHACGSGGFECIGTDNEQSPLILQDYISYDEMQIAALLGASVPTYFINNGSRDNCGKPGTEGSFETQGVLIGCVGARFEKEGRMEWEHMIVTQKQNTSENGYGAYSQHKERLAHWAHFYGVQYFPSFTEAQDAWNKVGDNNGRFFKICYLGDDIYLDTYIYMQRLRAVILPFLYEANAQGKAVNKRVYCRVVGLGLGAWALSKEVAHRQSELMLYVYDDTIRKTKLLSHIAAIDFSFFDALSDDEKNELIHKSRQLTSWNADIDIIFSHHNLTEKLTGKHQNNLLVAMYAWDGNAYPGNEYWIGNLTGSGDPAAAACSTIQELQNPLINTRLPRNGHFYPSARCWYDAIMVQGDEEWLGKIDNWLALTE